jgi:hypothetical protein
LYQPGGKGWWSGLMVTAEVVMTQQMVWKCEQWLGGNLKEQNLFLSEGQAREFVRKLAGMSPDLVFKIEPMPIQHVWN